MVWCPWFCALGSVSSSPTPQIFRDESHLSLLYPPNQLGHFPWHRHVQDSKSMSLRRYLLNYCPSRSLPYRAATKVLNPSVTDQPLDGATTMDHGLYFCFQSSSPGFLWSTTLPLSLWGPMDATFVMELAPLRSTYPSQRHRFLVVKVLLFSYWHDAMCSRLKMILGQKTSRIFLRRDVWKDDSLARSCSAIRQYTDP